MIFSYKVIQIGFIKELIAINSIEHVSEADKSTCRNKSKYKSIFGKESFFVGDCLECFTLFNHFSVHVDVEIEYKRIYDWINLEMH